MSLYKVFYAASAFLYIIRAAIFIYAVLSWFRPRWQLYGMLEHFITPFIMPFRRLSVWITAKTRLPLDFSCWFALIGISIIDQLWWKLYYLLRLI